MMCIYLTYDIHSLFLFHPSPFPCIHFYFHECILCSFYFSRFDMYIYICICFRISMKPLSSFLSTFLFVVPIECSFMNIMITKMSFMDWKYMNYSNTYINISDFIKIGISTRNSFIYFQESVFSLFACRGYRRICYLSNFPT